MNTTPNPTPKAEKTVEVELLADVWLDDGAGGTVRVTTNTPVLDEDGKPMIDKKSHAAVVTIEKRKLPYPVAKSLIAQGKARAILVEPE